MIERVGVFGIDPTMEPMAIAKESIKRLEHLLFTQLDLQRTFTEIGIKREDFSMMARKACRYGDIRGFKTLTPEDVERIYEMCL